VAVKAVIKQATEAGGWTRIFDEQGQPTDREYKTAVHCMEKTKAFTLIIQRWPNPKPDLFHPEFYCYHVFATNDDNRSTRELIEFHNGRGNAENHHKELKRGFGMDYFPCQRLRADAVWLELGVLGHNLTVVVKWLVLGGDWTRKTIATLRWELVFIAGKVVRHGRELWLQVRTCYYELLKLIRDRLRLVFAPTSRQSGASTPSHHNCCAERLRPQTSASTSGFGR
ncbi:MAG: transposase, partial [candidate division WOR-3 bacterium]